MWTPQKIQSLLMSRPQMEPKVAPFKVPNKATYNSPRVLGAGDKSSYAAS